MQQTAELPTLDSDVPLTPDEAAPLLRCGVDHVWKLCRDGKLKHRRNGRRILIRRQDISDYIDDQIRQAMRDGD
jgi:excisionase family DNA binding protein